MNVNTIMAGLVSMAGTGQSNWDLSSFLENSKSQLVLWGGAIVSLLGVVLIIVGVFHLVKKFISPQQGGGGWAMPIIMVIVGGALLTGGWGLIATISGGGQKTIEDLGADKPAAVIMLPADFYGS